MSTHTHKRKGGEQQQQQRNHSNNGFFHFMKARQPELERSMGRRVALLSEVRECIRDEWEALPQVDRTIYQQMASRQKQLQQQQKREKLDNYGVPLRLREEVTQMKVKEEEAMNAYIEALVNTHKDDPIALGRHTFYIISTSIYVCTDEGVLVPAEMSVVKWGFKDGITKEMHALFKCDIPSGYWTEAFEHSDLTHHLLTRENGEVRQKRDCLAKTSEEVLSQLHQFFDEESSGHLFVFMMNNQDGHTKKLLQQLIGSEQLKISGKTVNLCSLEKLFKSLYSTFVGKICLSQASSMMKQSWYDYHPSIACTVHNLNEGGSMTHCTLSQSRRLIYMMTYHMKVHQVFDMPLVKGKHYPEEDAAQGMVVNVPDMVVMDGAIVWDFDLKVSEVSGSHKNSGHLVDNNSGWADMWASLPVLAEEQRTSTLKEGANLPYSAPKYCHVVLSEETEEE